MHIISIVLGLILLVSIGQGIRYGAFGSMRKLLVFLMEGLATMISLAAAWYVAQQWSPYVEQWLQAQTIAPPEPTMPFWQRGYATAAIGLRDFPLMRMAVLFVLLYMVCKQVLNWVARLLLFPLGTDRASRRWPSLLSSMLGACIGVLIGLGRAWLVVAVLFVYTLFVPQSSFAAYVQKSNVYQETVARFIEPWGADLLRERLPVLAEAVEREFRDMLQRKYDVVDAAISDDIAEAAKQVVAGKSTDEQKARALYHWVGTRIRYDWEKVEQYETRRIWKEQTPDDTFATREGVCIDYSRLYAVMARAVGLDVKVITGVGLDGRGGSGPHAWNEVYISEQQRWAPLDTTWAVAGDWFDPPRFADTHIPD